ncbi:uncharacterized protein LOC131434507 [Malaya genurostris]|uniref:uncharacterized protein LOC131434507 n=1 Tax=Malaya genurostris TaxID=325434 RepID=UPI0026F3E6C4|nr:uncharacterized protein LOC131434507 [Malaya genurostris]
MADNQLQQCESCTSSSAVLAERSTSTLVYSTLDQQHNTNHGTQLNLINSRLLEIDLKVNHLEYTIQEAFRNLDRTVEQLKESVAKLTEHDFTLDERNVVINVKLGGKEINLTRHPTVEPGSNYSESRTDLASSSSDSNESKEPKRNSFGSVLSKMKHQMKNAFSVPCILTPIFEIYPAKMFSKTAKKDQ